MTIESDPRWATVRARERGEFFYSVATTGVYCRPTCAARLPRPENVAFHETRAQAERAGFRPCLRCRPDLAPASERNAELVAALCRLIESREDVPTLAELAAHAGLSTFHAHRMFKAVTGLTPRAYAVARRAERARERLRTAPSVTEAIYGAGFQSSARFYANAPDMLGMTPTAYKAGGKALPIRFAVGQCSLGAILVAATERGVCAILLGDDPEELVHDLERRFPRAKLDGADPSFDALVARAVAVVEGTQPASSLPLDIRGTAFQQRVWAELTAIPLGATRSYHEIAAAIGQPKAVRAIAQACAANSLAVAIPCHRVIRTDGALSGYRWGVERKRALLERERS
ncbi:MAG TPA: bifunctional DNA-binding transcriptional regulator/O6-methylguanine-DNA methyltransferase Ada [Kofleriaceae bacterium]|jgi:AraC family transcriptional regulator of adaptative response/methylated-DNA-[protein]-cysteine methyltransferase